MLATPCGRTLAVLAVLLSLSSASLPTATLVQDSAPCALQESDRSFLRQALADWEIASIRYLRLPRAPLPWILAFDTDCSWHLAPPPPPDGDTGWTPSGLQFHRDAILIRSARHGGTVRPPAGDPFPVSPRIFAAHSASLGRAYFVMALPGVFAADPMASADPLLAERLRSVVSHEILHTRQLPHVADHVAGLRQRFALPPDIDDNIVERRFGGDAAFRAAWEKERDRFYEAVAEADDRSASRIAREAVAAMRARQARYYAGDARGFERLEQLFLNMEGAAEWVRFKLHEHDHQRFPGPADIIRFIRGRNNDWVQDEGLALVLLLDRFSGGWQERLLSPEMASPVDELERALGRSN